MINDGFGHWIAKLFVAESLGKGRGAFFSTKKAATQDLDWSHH